MTSPSLNLGSPVAGLASVTATGLDQGSAYSLIIQETAFSTVPFGSGCRLPGPNANEMTVYNEDPTNSLTVYPAAGDRIGTNAINAGVAIAAGQSAKFASFDTPQTAPPRVWHQMASSAGISLTVGDGTHSVSNTGSILISGGTVSGSSGNATITVTGPAGVTSVIAQGGPFLANGTITGAGTIDNSSASLTAHGIIIAEGTGAVVATAAMTAGQLLIGQSATADPVPTTLSGDATINAGGTITVSKIGGVTPATVANTGAVLNNGTVQVDNMMTLTGTNGGTTTIAPGSGTSWVVANMPTTAGTVTFAAAPAFAGQKSIFDIKYGATISTPSLNSSFVLGGGITYTPGTTASTIDRMEIMSPDGTHWVVQALSQGGTL